jgi:hypothetical protein
MAHEICKNYIYYSIRDSGVFCEGGFDIDVTLNKNPFKLGFKFTNHEGWCGLHIDILFAEFNVGWWKK